MTNDAAAGAVPSQVPPKKEGIGKYILFATLGCGFLVGLIALVVFLVFKMTGGPVRVVNAQLEALREKEFDKAYGFCSGGFKQNTSLVEFQKFVENYPILKDAKDYSCPKREISGNTAELQGTVNGNDGLAMAAEYRLVKERGEWKVEYIRLSSTGVAVRTNKTDQEGERERQEGEQQQQQASEQPPEEPVGVSTVSPGSALQISEVNVEKQTLTDSVTVNIRFKVTNFANDKSNGTARIHLIQGLKTFDPNGPLVSKLSRDGIKELQESGSQEYTFADFINTLSIPNSYPQGTYRATLIVHDQIGGQSAETSTQFDIP